MKHQQQYVQKNVEKHKNKEIFFKNIYGTAQIYVRVFVCMRVCVYKYIYIIDSLYSFILFRAVYMIEKLFFDFYYVLSLNRKKEKKSHRSYLSLIKKNNTSPFHY